MNVEKINALAVLLTAAAVTEDGSFISEIKDKILEEFNSSGSAVLKPSTEGKRVPTIGRIVKYRLLDEEIERLNPLNNNRQEYLPAMIVGVWSEDCVNLQIFVDGSEGMLWSTSRMNGEQKGQWEWFV